MCVRDRAVLVEPASSHSFLTMINPCMLLVRASLRYLIPTVILELVHAKSFKLTLEVLLLDLNQAASTLKVRHIDCQLWNIRPQYF